MKSSFSKKFIISVGLMLSFFFVCSTVNIFAGEWLSAKIDDLTYGYFRMGSIEGISLNKTGECEIALSADEHIELLTEINNTTYDEVEEKLKNYVKNYFATGNYGYSTEDNLGKLILIPYELEYSGQDNSIDAYVRLKPTSKAGNEVIMSDGSSVACYQSVFYMNGNDPVKLSRIGFNKEPFYYYYYPKSIEKDGSVQIVYALYFPENINLPNDFSCLDLQLETTYAKNNYVAMNWNVKFDGNNAESFDNSVATIIPYIYHSISMNTQFYSANSPAQQISEQAEPTNEPQELELIDETEPTHVEENTEETETTESAEETPQNSEESSGD